MLKKLFSHTLIYGLAPQITSVAGIFALPIITKNLTAQDYGISGIVLAYTGAFQVFSTLGLSTILYNAFFKMPKQYKWLWRQVYGFLILWSIPYTIVLAVMLYFIIPTAVGANKILLIFLSVAPYVLFGQVGLFGMYYYRFNQQPFPIAVRTIFFGLLGIGLNIYTISYLKLGYMGWAWTTFLTTILMNLSYWYKINIQLRYTPIFNFKRQRIIRELKVAAPTIPHYYAGYILSTSDRVVMDRLHVPVSNVGEYNLADRFSGYFGTLVDAGTQAVGPMIVSCYSKGQEKLARDIIFVFQIASLSATFIFCLWSKEILAVLIKNDALKMVYPLCIIMVMAQNYRPLYVGAINKLVFVEKTNALWQVSFAAGGTNIALNFIFIPIFGFKAAAYTTFTSLMYMGFAGHLLPKLKSVQKLNYHPIFWLSVIVLGTIGAYFLVETNIIVKIIITLIVSLIFVVALYYFKNKLSND